MSSDLDEWKLGVSRATAYVQSNAAIQVQVFGFYISALGLAVAIARPEVRDLVIFAFIPVSAFLLLVITAQYFSYIAYQGNFVFLYGRRFDPHARYRCHEDFWDDLPDASLREALVRMITYWKSLPYFAIWWAYIAGPPLLMVAFIDAQRIVPPVIVALLCPGYAILSAVTFAFISRKGWAAINHFEDKTAPNDI